MESSGGGGVKKLLLLIENEELVYSDRTLTLIYYQCQREAAGLFPLYKIYILTYEMIKRPRVDLFTDVC